MTAIATPKPNQQLTVTDAFGGNHPGYVVALDRPLAETGTNDGVLIRFGTGPAAQWMTIPLSAFSGNVQLIEQDGTATVATA